MPGTVTPMHSDRVFHLAVPEDWAAAQVGHVYDVSTRGRTLADEGFIHCSTAAQMAATANRFYLDLDRLIVLHVEIARLDAEVRWEPPVPGSSDLFPHVYGPIPLNAVVATRQWRRAPGSDWESPPS